MKSATEKRIAAFEERLTELSGLREKIKRLEAKLAILGKKIEAPKDWRSMVGRLPDTKMSREAVALGREIRKSQNKP